MLQLVNGLSFARQGTDISDPYHHQTDASIVIEDRAWVCAEAFIGQGVTIGEGAVCAARAVVVKDVESWTVVGGNQQSL